MKSVKVIANELLTAESECTVIASGSHAMTSANERMLLYQVSVTL